MVPLEVARFIRAMEFPPFDGAAVLVDGKRVLVDSVEEISACRGWGRSEPKTATVLRHIAA